MIFFQLLDEKAAELSTEDMFLVKLKLQETGQQFRVSDNLRAGRGGAWPAVGATGGGGGILDEKAAELSTEDMFLVKLKLQETGQQFRVSDNRGTVVIHVQGGGRRGFAWPAGGGGR